MNLYILRHGTTLLNEQGITQGHLNNKLSKNGKELTKNVAEANKDLQIDIIYSSPLKRTMQTAKIFNKYHKAKIIKDKSLIEIDQGIFTGKSKTDLTEEELKLKEMRSASCKMESYESVAERCKNFISFLKEECTFENVLIVTHNVNASIFEHILNNKKINFKNGSSLRKFNNAEIKHFIIKNG